MESLALTYYSNPSEDDKQYYKNLFQNIQYILPCEECYEHYWQKVKNIDKHLSNRLSLLKWVVSIHNEVNNANKKEILSFDLYLLNNWLNITDLWK